MADLGSVLVAHGLADSALLPLSHGDGERASYYLQLPGFEAIARWSALRNIVDKTGYWPVVLGGADDLARHRQALAEPQFPDFDQILVDAQALRTEAWLQDRLDRRRQAHSEEVSDLHEDWPADIQHDNTFSIPQDLEAAGFRDPCFVGLVPTVASWHVPALLRFGSESDGPSPAEHASVLARWERLYAAEVVGMTRDALELSVGHPPSDPAAAIDLAVEQFAYCASIVTQGTLTIERLAATLVNGRVWFFSWA